jgi:D-alanyl-D-alanine carboxypeptidase/D-alanyl-D-alanine-endopeptidase (penicillin-binding protein 4)
MPRQVGLRCLWRRLGVAVGLWAGLVVAPGVDPATAATLSAELRASLTQARAVSRELSVHVVSLPDGESVFGQAAGEPRIVASNAKLVTTAAALDRLGPGYFFETGLLLEGQIVGRRLVGNLAVLGGGDPNISGRLFEGDSLAVFRKWAKQLSSYGIDEVTGDLHLVHGLFDDAYVHPDWPRDQLMKWYEAPVSALSYSDNCVLVRVTSGDSVGAPAQVEVVTGPQIFELQNKARTIRSARHHWLAVDRKPGTNVITVNGMILKGVEPIDVWVTVNDPVEYFGAAFELAMELEGIRILGESKAVELLPEGGWWRIARHRSDLLSTLEVINRRSQNFYAESLVKLLGAELCREGTWKKGLEVLEEFLLEAGVSVGFELADGSGMSRGNRLSARQLTELLTFMFEHRYAREFILTLPYGGLEDHQSWRTRLAEEPYRERVFAKTGSLSGVSTLSGYVKAKSGKVYAFSVLCNKVRSVWRARRAQDAIVRALIDHG